MSICNAKKEEEENNQLINHLTIPHLFVKMDTYQNIRTTNNDFPQNFQIIQRNELIG